MTVYSRAVLIILMCADSALIHDDGTVNVIKITGGEVIDRAHIVKKRIRLVGKVLAGDVGKNHASDLAAVIYADKLL